MPSAAKADSVTIPAKEFKRLKFMEQVVKLHEWSMTCPKCGAGNASILNLLPTGLHQLQCRNCNHSFQRIL